MNLETMNLKEEFPITENRIFFDHAKVSPLPNRVRQAVNAFVEDTSLFGTVNYSDWMAKVESVRASFARLIHADVSEVAFVKNTSEGISIVANGLDWKPGDNVVIPDIEFPANVYPWWNLKRLGVETRFVPAIDGRVLFDDLVARVDSRTRILSVSSVECNSGFRNDLNRIGTFCKEKGILFCVDAIQSLGVLPMDVKRDHIDFLAADGHKWLLSVEGLGGFYISAKAMEKIHPAVVGWNSVINAYDFMNYDFTLRPDAQRFEEGSFNTMSIMAFGAALSLFHEVGVDNIERRVMSLGDRIIEGLQRRNFKILNSVIPEERSGSISFNGEMDLEKFSDYAADNQVSLTVRNGMVRLSPHFYNRESEIDRFFDLLDRFRGQS
jgi:cysteine desulfurase / selenocysteine lyase